MTERRHTVVEGDCIESIAAEYGYFYDGLWEAPENETLRAEREDGHLLLPGDEVVLPRFRDESVAAETGARHRFRRRGVPSSLSLQFLDCYEEARSGLPYRLEIEGEDERTGVTDEEGWIHEPIQPGARSAVLTLRTGDRPGDEETMELTLGALMPFDSDTGLRNRLHNLGYLLTDPDEAEEGEVSEALAAFQDEHDIEGTGELDDATRDALLDLGHS